MGCGASTKRLIVVTGATGQQGGAVVRALLKYHSDDFIIRAVTRNVDSEKAKELKKIGIEVVKGDFNDVNSLKEAFNEAYGVFCVTNFWEGMDADVEKKHAKNLATACEAVKAKHVIWSTLENTREVLKGKASPLKGDMTVPHFDAKDDSNEYFKSLPTTYFYTSFYYDNFINYKMLMNNTIAFNLADAPLPMLSLEDLGKAAAHIFTKNDLIGKKVYYASDILTCQQIAEVFTNQLGTKVEYYKMDDESYRNLQFPGAAELGNMLAFYREGTASFAGNRNEKNSKVLVPNPIKFETWVKENKSKFR
jgi:uncharacterized protein YbjT (DUF2867 family)